MMMELWTSDEIETILMQLDAMELPFKKYAFTVLEEGLSLLGTGASARVYEAEHRGTHKRKYAIKVIGFGCKYVDSDYFRKTVQVQRELGEWKNDVIKIYDFAELDVWLDEACTVIGVGKTKQDEVCPKGEMLHIQFIVMEKAKVLLGRDKKGEIVLNAARLADANETEVIHFASEIGHVLQRAQEKNILHRDIKLENIFYSEKKKQYKLGDFGVAKATKDGTAETIAFTKGYGAPEVVGKIGEGYDNTAEIYSFGMMLYVLMNDLHFPDSENYSVNLGEQYRNGYILPRPVHGSEEFSRVICKMCSYNPDDRYQSMEEVMQELDKLRYTPDICYKKQHNNAALAVGMLLWIAGIIFCTLTFRLEQSFDLSSEMLLLIMLGVIKTVLSINKKNTDVISAIILCMVVIYSITVEFSWGTLLCFLYLIGSAGMESCVVSGTLVSLYGTSFFQTRGFLAYHSMEQYSWITVALLSLSYFLFLQYRIILEDRKKRIDILFTNNRYWIIVGFGYLTILPIQWTKNLEGGKAIFKLMLGTWGAEFIQKVNMSKVAITGLMFVVVWLIRERVLIAKKK